MKKLMKVLLITFTVLSVSTVYSQSLGDLAKEEKKRRDAATGERIITEKEFAKHRSKPKAVKDAAGKPSASKENIEDKAAKKEKKHSPDIPP